MKIGKYTDYNEQGELIIIPALLNQRLDGKKHHALIRVSFGLSYRYELTITNDRTGEDEYVKSNLKPKTVFGLLNKYGIRYQF